MKNNVSKLLSPRERLVVIVFVASIHQMIRKSMKCFFFLFVSQEIVNFKTFESSIASVSIGVYGSSQKKLVFTVKLQPLMYEMFP